jgi:hypothetical protein
LQFVEAEVATTVGTVRRVAVNVPVVGGTNETDAAPEPLVVTEWDSTCPVGWLIWIVRAVLALSPDTEAVAIP